MLTRWTWWSLDLDHGVLEADERDLPGSPSIELQAVLVEGRWRYVWMLGETGAVVGEAHAGEA